MPLVRIIISFLLVSTLNACTLDRPVLKELYKGMVNEEAVAYPGVCSSKLSSGTYCKIDLLVERAHNIMKGTNATINSLHDFIDMIVRVGRFEKCNFNLDAVEIRNEGEKCLNHLASLQRNATCAICSEDISKRTKEGRVLVSKSDCHEAESKCGKFVQDLNSMIDVLSTQFMNRILYGQTEHTRREMLNGQTDNHDLTKLRVGEGVMCKDIMSIFSRPNVIHLISLLRKKALLIIRIKEGGRRVLQGELGSNWFNEDFMATSDVVLADDIVVDANAFLGPVNLTISFP